MTARRDLPALAAFAAVIALLLAPALAHFTDRLAGRPDDIDFTGSTALLEVAGICELRSVRLAVVVSKNRTLRAFEHGGTADRLGAATFFDTLPEAVTGIRV